MIHEPAYESRDCKTGCERRTMHKVLESQGCRAFICVVCWVRGKINIKGELESDRESVPKYPIRQAKDLFTPS